MSATRTSGWQGSPAAYAAMIDKAERDHGVPKNLLSRLLYQESKFNPRARNDQSGAQGIAQILPSTARSPGYGVRPIADPYKPAQAIPFAAAYLSAMRKQTGSWKMALAAYNGGLAAVQHWVKTGAWPRYGRTESGKLVVIGSKPRPQENSQYVAQITQDVATA